MNFPAVAGLPDRVTWFTRIDVWQNRDFGRL